jgi:hypothetical protein
MVTVTVAPTGASVVPLMGRACVLSAALRVPPLMGLSVMTGCTSLMCSSVALMSVLDTPPVMVLPLNVPPPVLAVTLTS